MGEGSLIGGVELVVLLLLAFVIVFAVVAKKLDKPYPIVLVLAGLPLGFVPGAPEVPLNPDLIFLVVLPPLLYAAAWQTSWRDFQYNISSILLLAFGLVGFTVAGVALAGPRLLPNFDWQSAFVLGAVVSTTDAIAATSVAKKLGLPKRIIDILEGESLVNDASGLLALEFGTAIITGGHVPSVGLGLWRLIYLSVAGIAVGMTLALIVELVEKLVEDGPVEIAISILTPYAAYLAAEQVHASGVLAVIACGLYLSRRSAHFFSPGVRIQAYAVWEALTFLLNGFVFVLIGLQLPSVLKGMGQMSTASAIGYGLALSALLVVLRMVWTFPGAQAARLFRNVFQKQKEGPPPAKQVFVVGWTGMRGVVALAAALSLPQLAANGIPFAQRNSIIFFTFVVIMVTLVLQGLTLPLVVRQLGLASPRGPNCEEQEARHIVLQAALERLEELRVTDGQEFADVYEDLEHHYKHRLFIETGEREVLGDGGAGHVTRFEEVSRELRRIERAAALQLRNHKRISDETWRSIERELDLVEWRLANTG